jgi:hypothetical protein
MEQQQPGRGQHFQFGSGVWYISRNDEYHVFIKYGMYVIDNDNRES